MSVAWRVVGTPGHFRFAEGYVVPNINETYSKLPTKVRQPYIPLAEFVKSGGLEYRKGACNDYIRKYNFHDKDSSGG